MAMLPVAQLYVRDVPDLHAPEEADLLQVLWCPFDHPIMPKTALFWRSAATVTDILTAPPEPPAMQFDDYLPEPCLLSPEQVTEYPGPRELSKELREELGDWSRWRAAGADDDNPYASEPELFYRFSLSVAPGWKVGGWPSWDATDPDPQYCSACGNRMDPLLSIVTFEEGDDETRSWFPYGEAADEPSPGSGHFDPGQPTAVQIGSGYDQQLYICPASPEHPHTELMQ
ncbi:hypothetical protein [Streptomyces sp. NPDC093094]|uniref:hypothetical protein n=1 Tax=Streptomyces sp. NPDC093094 TaxID=3366026 RepID=UPI0037FFA219